MYPSAELMRLAAGKAHLRQRIAGQRRDCVAAARVLARPVAWLDGVIALARQLAPLAQAVLAPLALAWAWCRLRREKEGNRNQGWLTLLLNLLPALSRWLGRHSG